MYYNSNSVCANLLQVKLTCKNSGFADNVRFLSHKYNINSSDWTNHRAILLKKLGIKVCTLCKDFTTANYTSQL